MDRHDGAVEKAMGYPLIYGRTSKSDFLNDFLIRPSFLDHRESILEMVEEALYQANKQGCNIYCRITIEGNIIDGVAGNPSVFGYHHYSRIEGRSNLAFSGFLHTSSGRKDISAYALWDAYGTVMDILWNKTVKGPVIYDVQLTMPVDEVFGSVAYECGRMGFEDGGLLIMARLDSKVIESIPRSVAPLGFFKDVGPMHQGYSISYDYAEFWSVECLWREEEIHREFQEVIQTISDMDRGLLGNIRNKQWIDLLDDIVKQLEAFVRIRTFFIKGIDRMETRECTPYIMSASSGSIRFLPCGISDTDDFIISGRIQSFSRKSLDDLIGFLRSEADRTQWDETNTLI